MIGAQAERGDTGVKPDEAPFSLVPSREEHLHIANTIFFTLSRPCRVSIMEIWTNKVWHTGLDGPEISWRRFPAIPDAIDTADTPMKPPLDWNPGHVPAAWLRVGTGSSYAPS